MHQLNIRGLLIGSLVSLLVVSPSLALAKSGKVISSTPTTGVSKSGHTVAAASSTTATSQSRSAAATSTAQSAQSDELARIQARGDTDIDARITSLTGLETKVTATAKLTTDQKSSLTNELKTEITSLQALKTKLDADTDLTTAKVDFQSIFNKHFIYAFYVPRLERIIACDYELNAAATLKTVATKLKAYIDLASQQGGDVTTLTASLTEMDTNLTEAQTKAQATLDSLLPLTVAGYPGNKATVQNAVSQINLARANLKTARTDANTIITGLKKLLTTVD